MILRKIVTPMCVACVLLPAPSAVCAQAQPERGSVTQEAGIPVTQLITIMAKRTGKIFVVDPRVRAEVMLINQDPEKISYAEFLVLLQVHDFVAMESGGLIRVIPAQQARQLPSPIVTGSETRADAELVTKIIPVRNMPAAMLVPILRPLLPQQAHFVASTCTNVLIVVDTFGNVRRIESLVQALDKGESYRPGKCEPAGPATATEGTLDREPKPPVP
jgi:type II secretory pathway component GspD/PulD (secretin)